MRTRGVAAVVLVASLAGLLGPEPAAASPAVLRPAAATTNGCLGQEAPPPPPAKEELAAPTPAPLPWPHEPIGGPALAACGDLGPPAPPGIDAASYVVADLDSGAILAARAPHARHRPASTLKILLALVVLGRLDPDSVVDGTADDMRVDGSRAGIGPGGQYTVRQLLAGLLLNSGNDTAEALARALGGDPETLAAMTATAREHGAFDTRPATPSGLDGPGMASSAYDLALLFRLVLRNPLFASTIATRSVPFPGYLDHPGFVLSSTDRFMPRYSGAVGAKAGFTDAARHTLVAAAERNGRRLVVVLMRGEIRPVPMWQQAAALLDTSFGHPAGTPALGQLVEEAPATPTPAPPAAQALTPDRSSPPPSAAVQQWLIAGAAATAGAVALMMLIVIVVRTRRRRSR